MDRNISLSGIFQADHEAKMYPAKTASDLPEVPVSPKARPLNPEQLLVGCD